MLFSTRVFTNRFLPLFLSLSLVIVIVIVVVVVITAVDFLSLLLLLMMYVELKRIGVFGDSVFLARDEPGRRFDKVFRQVTLAFHERVLLRGTHAGKRVVDVRVTGFVRSDGE